MFCKNRLRHRAFSLTEVLIVMVIACAFIAASLPVMTKLLVTVTGVDEAAKICIATQHATSLSFTGTDSSININSSSAECKKAIQGCSGNGGAFCNTIIAYTKDKDAAHKNAAKNVIKAACDLGGSDACQHIVNSCITQNDCTNLNYYLYLIESSLVEGRTKIIDKSISHYKSNVANLKAAVDDVCGSNGATACKIVCSGNSTACSDFCRDYGSYSACLYLADDCDKGDLNACESVRYACDDAGMSDACDAMKTHCGMSQNVCDVLANTPETAYMSTQCGTNKNDFACNGILNACAGGSTYACPLACSLGLKSCNMQKAIGGNDQDFGNALTKDSSGNLYMVGAELSEPYLTGITVISVIKFNPDLGIVWQKKIGNTSRGITGYDISISGNYIYILARDSYSPVTNYVIKMDLSGNVIWQKSIGGATFYKLATDSSGNVYLVGYADIMAQDMNYYSNGIIAKLDTAGNYLWNVDSGEDFEDEYFYSIAVGSNGNIYVIGKDAYGDLVVAYCNSSGILQAKNAYQSGLSGNNMALDSSNNIYITGTAYSTNYKIFAMKLNSSLAFQWGRSFNSTSSSDKGDGIILDSGENVYIAGTVGVRGGNDITVIKLDNAGTKQWQKLIGDTNSESGKDVLVGSDGFIYVVGLQRSASTSDDISMIKLSPNQTDALPGNMQAVSATVFGSSIYSIGTSIYTNISSLTSSTSSLTIRDAVLTGL